MDWFSQMTDDQVFEAGLAVVLPLWLIGAGWVTWLAFRNRKQDTGKE